MAQRTGALNGIPEGWRNKGAFHRYRRSGKDVGGVTIIYSNDGMSVCFVAPYVITREGIVALDEKNTLDIAKLSVEQRLGKAL